MRAAEQRDMIITGVLDIGILYTLGVILAAVGAILIVIGLLLWLSEWKPENSRRPRRSSRIDAPRLAQRSKSYRALLSQPTRRWDSLASESRSLRAR